MTLQSAIVPNLGVPSQRRPKNNRLGVEALTFPSLSMSCQFIVLSYERKKERRRRISIKRDKDRSLSLSLRSFELPFLIAFYSKERVILFSYGLSYRGRNGSTKNPTQRFRFRFAFRFYLHQRNCLFSIPLTPRLVQKYIDTTS